jgi:hypothetical protein
MRRCASENDMDETLWIVGLATLVVSFSDSKACEVPLMPRLSTWKV